MAGGDPASMGTIASIATGLPTEFPVAEICLRNGSLQYRLQRFYRSSYSIGATYLAGL